RSDSTLSLTRCSPAASAGRASSSGAGGTAGCGCAGIGRIRSGSGYWSWWGEANAEWGMRNAEQQGTVACLATPAPTFRIPHSAFRIRVVASMSVVVVLHEPQD